MAITAGLITAGISLGKGILESASARRQDRKQRERYERLLSRLGEIRERTIQRGIAGITGQTQGLLAQGRTAAARRASAMGLSDAESLMLPMEAQTSRAGTDAMRQYLQGVQGRFDEAEMEAEFGFAARPIPESPVISMADTVLGVGAGALQYKQDMDYMNVLRDAFTQRQDILNRQFGISPTQEKRDISQDYGLGSGFYGARQRALGRRSPLFGGK